MKTLFVLLFASASALADDGAMRLCRDISSPAARLSCYDALPLATPAGKPAERPIGAAPIGQATAKQALEQSFGMEYEKKTMLDTIESTIPGSFDGWGPRQTITLANGQVWMVDDDSDGVLRSSDNTKVVISRGALGAIYMEIAGSNKAPRVRRLK
jgi:hypothetical protein